MTMPGDRVPIPPGEGGPIEELRPVPTPIRWAVHKMGRPTPTGEPLVLLKFWLVTGEVVLFLPASAATRLADQLFTEGSGLTIASADDLPGPQ